MFEIIWRPVDDARSDRLEERFFFCAVEALTVLRRNQGWVIYFSPQAE